MSENTPQKQSIYVMLFIYKKTSPFKEMLIQLKPKINKASQKLQPLIRQDVDSFQNLF